MVCSTDSQRPVTMAGQGSRLDPSAPPLQTQNTDEVITLLTKMKRLFEGSVHATKYASFRPTYPTTLYSAIYDFCSSRGNLYQNAIDVACGSGQSTLPLTEKFKKVTGIDISSAQISKADTASTSNVNFKVGPAEDLSFYENESVDLITCAQGLHWLDFKQFIKETDRVLHTGSGVVAAYGYGNVKLQDDESSNTIWKFYKDVLGSYWDNQRKHIDEHYQQFTLPYKDFHRLDDLELRQTMTMDSFIGYISTWSAYQTYQNEHPESTILEELHKELNITTKGAATIEATWPLFMLIASKQ